MSNGELGWNDELDPKAAAFETLPPGAYDFVVAELKKERFPGSTKMGPCDMPVLTLRVEANGMKAQLTHRLFLHTKCEGLLVAFFRSIGAATNEAGRVRMEWNNVVGARGRCLIEAHEFKGRDGDTITGTQVKKFLTPDEAAKVELAKRPEAPATGSARTPEWQPPTEPAVGDGDIPF